MKKKYVLEKNSVSYTMNKPLQMLWNGPGSKAIQTIVDELQRQTASWTNNRLNFKGRKGATASPRKMYYLHLHLIQVLCFATDQWKWNLSNRILIRYISTALLTQVFSVLKFFPFTYERNGEICVHQKNTHIILEGCFGLRKCFR